MLDPFQTIPTGLSRQAACIRQNLHVWVQEILSRDHRSKTEMLQHPTHQLCSAIHMAIFSAEDRLVHVTCRHHSLLG